MTGRLMKEYLGIQFFGEYLVDHWIITREQLLEAFEYQQQRNLRFGEIAVKKGLLTPAQVREVNDRQRTADLDFGESAVSMGLLTIEQVKAISVYQRNNNLCLGEALLRLGHIDDAVLERELAAFAAQQAEHAPKQVVLPEGVPAASIIRACVDATSKMFLRVVRAPLKVGRGLVLEPIDDEVPLHYYTTVSLRMQATEPVRYTLSVTEKLAARIAASILKEESEQQPAELIIDAVKELSNIICGNAAAALAKEGEAVEISPPETLDGIPRAARGTVAFPVRSSSGGVDLRFLRG